MKKKAIIILTIIVIAAVAATLILGWNTFFSQQEPQEQKDDHSAVDEGVASLTKESEWISPKDNSKHKVGVYDLGTTAERVKEDLPPSCVIRHLKIDDIPLYEICPKDTKDRPILFFFHGQTSRKEESLDDMQIYADKGCCCVSIDLRGHGERITDTPMTGYDITSGTAEDVDVVLNYYEATHTADTGRFAFIGFSQGGCVAYWYAVYGERTPSALAVGSTTPDLTYSPDRRIFVNGKFTGKTMSKEESDAFIKKYNPIDHADKLATMPILSGNSLEDPEISYKGSEELEKILKDMGNEDIYFYYFDSDEHNVTQGFMEKTVAFIEKYLPINP